MVSGKYMQVLPGLLHSFQKMSLDALAKKILGVRMDKSWRI